MFDYDTPTGDARTAHGGHVCTCYQCSKKVLGRLLAGSLARVGAPRWRHEATRGAAAGLVRRRSCGCGSSADLVGASRKFRLPQHWSRVSGDLVCHSGKDCIRVFLYLPRSNSVQPLQPLLLHESFARRPSGRGTSCATARKGLGLGNRWCSMLQYQSRAIIVRAWLFPTQARLLELLHFSAT